MKRVGWQRVLLLACLCALAWLQCAAAAPCDPTLYRRDCGYVGINEQECNQRGCCWSPTGNGIPWCFFKNGLVNGYQVTSATPSQDGMTLQLALKDGNAFYGADIPLLTVHVSYQTDTRVRVRIVSNQTRWEIPSSIVPDGSNGQSDTQGRLSPAGLRKTAAPTAARQYKFSYTSYPFGFAVTRVSDGMVLVNTTTVGNFNGLVFEDQYLQLSTQLPHDAQLYGMGEHVRALKLDVNGDPLTLWNRDAASPVNQNIYGSHPYYMELRDGKAHGVFMRNSNGMDFNVYSNHASWNMIGGVVDMYVFVGPDPETVTQQYHQLIGTPHMPPLWSLGFHLCRYGFKNVGAVETVIAQMQSNDIPLETMWTDIDYMDGWRDFTFDPINFPLPEMQKMVSKLHSNGQKYVVIVDPGIKQDSNYQAWNQGLADHVYMKDAQGNNFIGKVWPGLTAFPDWFAPNISKYWGDQISMFRKKLPVDGLWIDMNEASNFCNGECSGVEMTRGQAYVQPKPGVPGKGGAFDPNNPPYMINNCGNRCPMDTKTIAMDATVYGGQLEYNVHNLYGHMEGIHTNAALEAQTQKRSLVITRSSFSSTGHHVGHWLGDNYSTFQSMAYSIPGILAMNMFGIPLVGADMCGFIGSTTEELCARWMQLGAFTPFTRNHNTIGAPSQEPYVWPSVAAISKTVLRAKYSIINLFHTLHYKAAVDGGTVVRPMFFEWPSVAAVAPIDAQFMIGGDILVTPVLENGERSVTGYFPAGEVWYDFWDYSVLSGSGWVKLDAPLDKINVHIRGGRIIPMQTPKYTTQELQTMCPFYLLVALDSNMSAQGSLYLDDGETLNYGRPDTSSFINYSAGNGQLVATTAMSGYKPSGPAGTLTGVTVLGLSSSPSSVSVNGQSAQFTFNNNVLQVSGFSTAVVGNLNVQWS